MAVCCSNDTDKKPEKTPMDPEEFYHVMVIGARGLRNTDWMPGLGKPDCYCEVRAIGEGASEEPLHVTKTINNTLEPMWREEASLRLYKKKQALQFTVWDKDLLGPAFLGKVELKAGYFNKYGFNGELPLEESGKGIIAYLRFKISAPNMPYPKPPSPTFDVGIERNSKYDSWGIELDVQDDRHLYIADIAQGPFQKYNDEQDNDDLKVVVTDFITAVNGKETSILQALKDLEKGTVTIRRGLDLTMIVEKKEASLAAAFACRDVSEGGLVITSLGDRGAFKAYNDETDDPTMKIQIKDRIVSIDGKKGTSIELLRMLENAEGTFQIRIIRCAPDGFVGDNTANRWCYYD
eukprot:CAMPEP_0172662694 /NCGR_PEP_ID=MMETSP1074-20121228/5501_1 /TAXON_ID=2916 /ORGANISM="Ceratium fusus, Strain PA161109" /LENGTH=349 /DNA_ID=CAMNT_0013478625 /DNA_START=149 /DNA_END=1198 /DNA_ORIENTATION=+